MNAISHADLLATLDYDPLTGIFRWKVTRGRFARPGTVAGSKNNYGYVVICLNRSMQQASRLAWFYVNNEWPPNDIDHINKTADDNRYANLRLATRSQNLYNRTSCNRTGLKGVKINHKSRKNPYVAYIRLNGIHQHLGCFPSAQEAHRAYCNVAKTLHGEFFSH